MSELPHEPKPGVSLKGELPVRLWGLPLREWQTRAWKKAGAADIGNGGALVAGIDWVLSPALAQTLLAQPGAALVVEDEGLQQERIVAVHVPAGGDRAAAEALVNMIDPDRAELDAAGYIVGGVDDFASEYNKALRKREPQYALSLMTQTPSRIEARLFKGSYKGVTDIVTKYVWPVPALHVTRLCANLRLTPNMVTTASLLLVVLAFYLFWIGAWLPGIAAGWAMTFLDTVDGKLARTTMTYSKWGNVYDHGIDLIHPPFWYWAIWEGLRSQGAAQEWLTPALVVILVGYVLGRVVEGIFMRAFGFHIHVWKRIDAVMREITARRNPNLLIFMVATLLGQPAIGLLLVAVWTAICVPFHAIRLVQAYAARGPVRSFMES